MNNEVIIEGNSIIEMTDFDDSLGDSVADCLILNDVFIEWMEENIGSQGQDWTYHGIVTLSEYDEGLSFTFNTEEDIVAFKLRWT